MRAQAQAKINLRLKVLSRQDTGYHAIETVFLRLDLSDTVTVDVHDGSGISVEVSGPPDLVFASGPAEQNLALIAAAAYCERTDWSPRVDIRVEKRIPVGAGLGGGSADAAAVLRALNSLAPGPLPPARLLALAADIGSDVPFLTGNDVMAVGWGRGERLMSLPALAPRPVILAVPPVAVSTRDAYDWLGRDPGDPPPPAVAGDAFSSWESTRGHAENDFSAPVAARFPIIETIRESLLARGARIAMLTGSGSAVFGVFDQGAVIEAEAGAGEWRELATSTAAHVVPLEPMD
ncbi:MAG TPA: 4-(cytidine 5'-diphospho)-2-C-methyl-D-erythritol kinase [Gemmatimonadaceae bacterium]|nr:4-(cytidine 5'-diphospho)-2-C-methyl-D-erythritol kinase [Gemmatimonadaceae bacterium]